MENIVLHIQYLLLRHDCVIVPGFGAFIVAYTKPVFDLESGTVSPMKREVRFNSLLHTDDGLLTNSYARKYGISYREASELLGRDISSLCALIESEGEVAMGNLGILKKSEEGTLLFSPFRSATKLAFDLGFHAVVFESRENMDAKTCHGILDGSDDVVENRIEDNDSDEGIARKFDTRRNFYIPVNKVLAKTAAIILVVVTLCLTTLLPSTSRQVIEDRASVVPVDRIIETVIGSERHAQDAVVGNSEKREDEIIEDEKISVTLPEYYLIVGTFRTEKEAEKYVATHEGSSFELEILSKGKLSRVSAKKSTNRDELLSTMNEPDFKSRFAESWIWKNK